VPNQSEIAPASPPTSEAEQVSEDIPTTTATKPNPWSFGYSPRVLFFWMLSLASMLILLFLLGYFIPD